jgi:hypothetical protein
MTDDFQAIDGVGPAREEHFIDEGYEVYADLAEADPAELSEQISNLPEDSALEIVVQAQNLTDLEEAEVEEDPEVEETETITESNDGTDVVMNVEGDEGEDFAEDQGEDVSENEGEDVEESSETEAYSLELTLASDGQYDAFYDTLLSHRNTLIGRNSHEVDRYTDYIDELREAVVGDTLEYELTADEINSLHNAIRQKRLDYQGANLNDQLAPARELETKFNNQREELIF